MPSFPIQLKRNGTAAATPSSLLHGEVALNYADGKLFWKDASNVIQSFTFQAYALSSHTHAASDITSGTFDAARIANDSITYAKLQNVSATDRLLGRSSAGAGDVEEITCTAFGRSLIDDADSAAARTTLSVQPTASPTFTGTLTAAQARVNGSDSSTVLLVNGATKGVRFNLSSTSSAIEGVDNGGVSSYQPLVVGGSTVTLATAGASAITIDGSQKATLAAQLLVTAGSVSAPGVAFSSGDTNTGMYSPSADVLALVTNGSERVRVDADGRVQINRASPLNQEMLTVLQASVKPGVVIKSTATSGTAEPSLYLEKQDNNNTTAQKYVLFAYNAGVNGAGGIEGNGGTGAQFYSSSDARLKQNIADLAPQLANIMAMKPRVFDYISGPTGCTGFVAQELEQIYPDAVGVDASGYKTIGGISVMETRIIRAIQELAERIAALEERLNHA